MSSIIWKIIIPGATPKVTISAMLSNCFPISEVTFNNLADNPSKKSSIAPKKIKVPAKCKLFSKEKTIATNPQNKFPRVIRFGMFLLIEFMKLQ